MHQTQSSVRSNVNWQLFFSTFVLVFLAEMGDKTQMTVLCQTATTSSKWTVFAAGALALTAATAIGVLAGSVLRRYVPDVRWIRCAGGTLFLIFGALMLVQVFQSRRAEAAKNPVEKKIAEEWLGHSIIQQTEILERFSFSDYASLAVTSLDPEEKDVFTQLEKEEQWHHESMLCAMASGIEKDIPFTQKMAARLPKPSEVISMACRAKDSISQAISNEYAMAHYYRVLSENVTEKRLRETFDGLAVAEENHARRLEGLKKK